MNELEKAVGQYVIYRTFMQADYTDRELYLAVSADVYQDIFQRPAIQDVVTEQHIHLLVFEPDLAEVIQSSSRSIALNGAS